VRYVRSLATFDAALVSTNGLGVGRSWTGKRQELQFASVFAGATHRAALSSAKRSIYDFLDCVFLDVLGVCKNDEFTDQAKRKDLDPQNDHQGA